jgi:protein-L-isoaspartate(D-aspartate) O-methyltransferase
MYSRDNQAMTTGTDEDGQAAARERMVAEQIAVRGVSNPAVLSAMREVPRHLFVPEDVRAYAYADHPLQIGHGQTISQPYIVALMTELARPTPSARALEVGSGSGYQAAVLSRVVGHVFSVEINEELSRQAAERLARLGYANVTLAHADGHAGWASEAPFDIVLVTAAPVDVPPALVDQLVTGGRLVIPVGPLYAQDLRLIEKEVCGRTRTSTVAPVIFVPMVDQ